jgi:hypothetical protein
MKQKKMTEWSAHEWGYFDDDDDDEDDDDDIIK